MTEVATTRTSRDGLLLVDKHEGCTSHDVVASARRLLRIKKIGHCGTLDPSATGLLLLTIGRATRLTRFLIQAPKTYEGTIRFGITTDTYDLEGRVTSESPLDGVTPEAIDQAMTTFVGEGLQTPPPYCAKKVGGVKYYELARRGEEVPQDPKEVTIYDFRCLEPWSPGQDLRFELSCASGTYARSLAHDLGGALGCGGLLSSLRRTKVGPFGVTEAVSLEELAGKLEEEADLGSAWLPFDEIPLPFTQVTADPQQERRIQHGQTVLIRELEGREGDWIKVVNKRHKLIAIGSVIERIGSGSVGVIQPKVVFQ